MDYRLLRVSALVGCIGALGLAVTPGQASALGKGMRECKASGPPSVLAVAGAHERIQMLEERGQRWLVTTDDPAKSKKLQLLTSDGQAIELGQPQVTTEVTSFVARGQGTYAMASMRSALTPGKKDVVLLRWGSDSRPRMTVLSTTDRVDAKPAAALVNEYATALWAQPNADASASHLYAAAIDLEELKVSPTQDLGTFEPGGFIHTFAHEKTTKVVWSAPDATMLATLDMHGKRTGAAITLQRKDTGALRGAQLCGDKLWLLSKLSDKELAVSTADAAGVVTQIATLPAPPSEERLPLSCVDTGVIIAHPVFTAKTNNIVVWVTAVDADGKKRERRLKDEKGAADSARTLELQGEKDPNGAWWAEGQGADTKFVFRPLACE